MFKVFKHKGRNRIYMISEIIWREDRFIEQSNRNYRN